MQYCGVVPITRDSAMLFPTSLVTIIYNLWIQPRDKIQRKWTQTPVSAVMKSLSGFMSLWVHALISISRFFFPNLLPKWRTLHYNVFPSTLSPWLSPLSSTKRCGLLLGHALIFQLPWVNRDELASESKLSTLWMGSSAKFPQLRRKHQSCCLWKWQVLWENNNNLFMQRAISAEASSPQSDSVFQEDTFPGLSERCCRLFSLREAAHQISISRLEMSLGSRQVVFRGLMTADLWMLSVISAIGVAVMTGAAASAPHRSSRSNHSKPVKWFWCMTFTFRGPLDLLSRCVNSKTAIPLHPPESPFKSALCMHREPGNSSLSYFSH